jgi:hypothetical protein
MKNTTKQKRKRKLITNINSRGKLKGRREWSIMNRAISTLKRLMASAFEQNS